MHAFRSRAFFSAYRVKKFSEYFHKAFINFAGGFPPGGDFTGADRKTVRGLERNSGEPSRTCASGPNYNGGPEIMFSGKSAVKLFGMFSTVAAFALLGFVPGTRLAAQTTGDV